ncbi:hypothetical protein F53441_12541 [Fusarium austroafricanum]|uniref:Neutral protease 2 n=1 Tax=Fusarium austroafricanum TaxID=2364996 RepID=A0A8H4JV07_9HYPO|nr:hypothetical protein F53441_12541 [Fusarium austroafricanum]
MRFYQTLASVACLAIGVQAHLPVHARNNDHLTVALDRVTGQPTKVNVSITNNGASDMSLLKIGTILDERPVKKLTLIDESQNEVSFKGIGLELYYDALKADHFRKLSSGSSIYRIVDLATTHDLKPGTYSVYAEGNLPSAFGDSGKPISLSFKSEAISIKVTKVSSAEVTQKVSKRTIMQNETCTPEQLEATVNSVKNCEVLARAAAKDASDVSSDRFVEFFKSNETSARELVTGRLLAVAEECSSPSSGNTRIQCKDEFGYCESNGPLIAYTTWVNGWVTMCPLFYDTLPAVPQKCHKQDQASTTLHEMTHARAVYEEVAATGDYAYSYPNVTALDPLTCLYNADSYSLYANAVYLDCEVLLP